MIALILTQKNQQENKEKDKNPPLTWLSKDGIWHLNNLPFPKSFEPTKNGHF